MDCVEIAEALDNKKIEIIKEFNYNNNETDIILELYNKGLLTLERLRFIIDKCMNYLAFSSTLVKLLIKNNNKNLLNIILNSFKLFDNEFIIKLILYYKKKVPISKLDFNEQIGKYQISLCNEVLVTCCEDFLYDACKKRYDLLVKYLVKHGADINKRKFLISETPLFPACKTNNENMVIYLIEHGSDVNIKNWRNETALFYACRNDNEIIIKYLIDHGAKINLKNKIFETPLEIVLKNGNENIAKYLVEKGADLNNGYLLKMACEYGNPNIVTYLIEHGAQGINEIFYDGFIDETLLFRACRCGNESIVKCLIDHGANINVRINYNPETPLTIALIKLNSINDKNHGEQEKNKYVNIIKYLVEHGANININNWKYNSGETPLFNVCSTGNESLVHHFIKYRANINKENKDGKTPIFSACSNGNENLVKYLFEHGADINKKDNEGETPLFVAHRNGNKNIIKFLIDHGGNI